MKIGWLAYTVILCLVCTGAGYYSGYEDGRKKGQREAWNAYADHLEAWADKEFRFVKPPRLPRYND